MNTPVEAVVAPIGVLLIEPAWRLPVPVALEKVNPAKAETPETFKEPKVAFPEVLMVVPVALEKVRP